MFENILYSPIHISTSDRTVGLQTYVVARNGLFILQERNGIFEISLATYPTTLCQMNCTT